MYKRLFFIVLALVSLPSLIFASPPPPPATPGSPSGEDISNALLFEQPKDDETVIQNQRVQVELIFINDESPEEIALLQDNEVIHTWTSEPYQTNIQIDTVGTYELSAYAVVNGGQIDVRSTKMIDVQPLPSGVDELINESQTDETTECQATYVCEEWSQCIDGEQTRLCEDINECREDQEVSRECETIKTIEVNQESYELVPREGGYFIDATLHNDSYNVTLSAEAESLFELLTANNNLYEAEKTRNTNYILTKINTYQSPANTTSNTLPTLITTIAILLALSLTGYIITRQGTVNKVIKESQITNYLKNYARKSKKQIKNILNNKDKKQTTHYHNIAAKAKTKQKEREKLRKFLKKTSGTMREKKQALIKAGWKEENIEKEIKELLKEKAL